MNNQYVGSADTDDEGNAFLDITLPRSEKLQHSYYVGFAGSEEYGYLACTPMDTGSVSVYHYTTLALTQPAATKRGRVVILTSNLRSKTAGARLRNMKIDFVLGSARIGSARTNGNGVATLRYRVPASRNAGNVRVEARYAGNANYYASTGARTLRVVR
jgi:hypothetical protein